MIFYLFFTFLDDDGSYTCRVKVERSRIRFSEEFRVSVHVPPKTIPPQLNTLLDTGRVYNSFEEVAYCNALDGKPAASVTWDLPSIVHQSDYRKEVSQIDGEYMTKTTKSVLRLVPRKLYNHIIATCKVEHPSFEKPISYSVNISIECEFFQV